MFSSQWTRDNEEEATWNKGERGKLGYCCVTAKFEDSGDVRVSGAITLSLRNEAGNFTDRLYGQQLYIGNNIEEAIMIVEVVEQLVVTDLAKAIASQSG